MNEEITPNQQIKKTFPKWIQAVLVILILAGSYFAWRSIQNKNITTNSSETNFVSNSVNQSSQTPAKTQTQSQANQSATNNQAAKSNQSLKESNTSKSASQGDTNNVNSSDNTPLVKTFEDYINERNSRCPSPKIAFSYPDWLNLALWNTNGPTGPLYLQKNGIDDSIMINNDAVKLGSSLCPAVSENPLSFYEKYRAEGSKGLIIEKPASLTMQNNLKAIQWAEQYSGDKNKTVYVVVIQNTNKKAVVLSYFNPIYKEAMDTIIYSLKFID